MTRRHYSPPASTPRRRLLRRDQSGAAAVEFALVVGLFAFILYGLVAFGVILAQKQKVTNAAAEAARATVGAADLPAATILARQRVESELGTTGYLANYADDPMCGSPAKCIKVTIVYDLPPSPGLGLVTPSTTTAIASVQYL